MVSDIQSLSCLRKTMPLKTGFFQVMTWKLDSKVRFFNDITVAIWIPNTWIPDSSEKQAVWVSGIQMVVWLGGPFKYWTFWTGFQTTIWIPGHSTTDTNLPFEYLTSLVFRWLLYYLKTQLVKVQFSDVSVLKVSSIWIPTPIFFFSSRGTQALPMWGLQNGLWGKVTNCSNSDHAWYSNLIRKYNSSVSWINTVGIWNPTIQ